MAKTVRDVMTRNPVSMPCDASVTQAAKAMSDHRIGAVVVMDRDTPLGIVTDRDITVRTVATGNDPAGTKLADICSKDVAAVHPDQPVDDAIEIMKSHDIKRVLVIDERRLEGIVTLGDLTARGEGDDVHRDISRSEPNN